MKYSLTSILIPALASTPYVCQASAPNYSVLSWQEVYVGLMREIDAKGPPRFFSTPESSVYAIDEKGEMILKAAAPKYLERFLNAKAEEGYELIAIDGTGTDANYIFRRK